MLAYLDAGSGAALATLIASGAVGASAVLGSARRRMAQKLGRSPKPADAGIGTSAVDADGIDDAPAR